MQIGFRIVLDLDGVEFSEEKLAFTGKDMGFKQDGTSDTAFRSEFHTSKRHGAQQRPVLSDMGFGESEHQTN